MNYLKLKIKLENMLTKQEVPNVTPLLKKFFSSVTKMWTLKISQRISV